MFVPALLRRYRAQESLSQQELAKRAGVARTTVNKIERGLAAPRPSTLRRLARALHVKPRDLLSDEP